MDSLKKLLKSKAGEIDIDAKREDIHLAKLELARFYDEKVAQVIKVEQGAQGAQGTQGTQGTLTIRVRSSAVASEIRLGQVKILEAISHAINQKLERIHIKVGR